MKKILTIICTIVAVILGIILYSRFIGTSGLVTKEIKIDVENLTSEYNGFKIIHFSDLHYGTTIKEKQLKKIVDEINLNKPDIVVFTGDLLDDNIELTIEEYDKLTELLNNINARIGKYIISGNHDTSEKWENIISNGGFIDLNDKAQLIFDDTNIPILIAGLYSNLNINSTTQDRIEKINQYIDELNIKPTYSILLIHEPDYIDQINTDYFNLILAGHSHGGQIKLPGIGPIMTPIGSKKYNKDYYRINNSDLYISSGLGISKIKLRLFDRPSINFYRLVKN